MAETVALTMGELESVADQVPAGRAAPHPAPGGGAPRAERAPDPAPLPGVRGRRRRWLGLPPPRTAEQPAAGRGHPRAGVGARARAIRRLRTHLRASEAHRGARPRPLGRNAARVDDRGGALGAPGAAHAAQPAAAAPARLF